MLFPSTRPNRNQTTLTLHHSDTNTRHSLTPLHTLDTTVVTSTSIGVSLNAICYHPHTGPWACTTTTITDRTLNFVNLKMPFGMVPRNWRSFRSLRNTGVTRVRSIMPDRQQTNKPKRKTNTPWPHRPQTSVHTPFINRSPPLTKIKPKPAPAPSPMQTFVGTNTYTAITYSVYVRTE